MSAVALIQFSNLDLQKYLVLGRQGFDRNLAAAADGAGHEPPLHHMLCVAGMKNPDAKSIVDLVPYLDLFHAGFMVVADERDWTEILELASIPCTLAQSVERGLDVGFLAGTLTQWRTALLRGCQNRISREVRHTFNLIYNEFRKVGVAGAFEFREKQSSRDPTFLDFYYFVWYTYNMHEDIKLITRTKKGTLLKVPATIEREGGRIYFVKSPFELKDEIKSMKGSRWHGFIPEDHRKIWSVEDCTRNNFQLDFMTGGNPYANWDQPLKEFGYTRSLFEHQKLMTNHCLTYHYAILAAEMGCVSGDAVVQVFRPKKKGSARKYNMTLRELYQRTEGKHKSKGNQWNADTPTYIQCLTDKGFDHTAVLKVLSKGVKPTITIELTDGRSITLTSDHQVYTNFQTHKMASELQRGDKVVVTGTAASEAVLDIDPPPEWDGNKITSLGSWYKLNTEGYVEVGNFDASFPVGWTTKQGKKVVKEQYLVMFEHFGFIPSDFIIHHLNGVKHDNRIENLALLKPSAHRNIHKHDKQSSKHQWVPCAGQVQEVRHSEPTDVYDVVCDHPHHNFVADGVVVSNCGKTLSAIELMEKANAKGGFWWVGPKSALAAVEREFVKWDLKVQPKLMTYDRLRIEIERWEPGQPAPQGLICDESSRAKTANAKRTKAAQHLANAIRDEWGWDGYVVLMSGSPSPKSPVDWWAQCEIAYPGFVKEGSEKAFEWRLGIYQKQMTDAGEFWKRKTWRDDENKCDVCGELADHADHTLDGDAELFGGEETHDFVPSKDEVSYLYERLQGLVVTLKKKDCLDIPEKIYREVILEPTSTLKRVAKALAKSAETAIQGLTWLRELSDGFQYKEKQEGNKECRVCKGKGECEAWQLNEQTGDTDKVMGTCPTCGGSGEVPNMVRDTKEIKTPKDQAIRDLLEENEDQGRLVVFAGFQGSIDRVLKLCHREHWDVVQVDGRGWKVKRHDGEKVPPKTKPLDYWADISNERVVFLAHPASGGMGLTLTESRMCVFYSNDFSPESRSQAEDRIHRPGMDENRGATIVDLFHLGTDRRVLQVLQDNRRLESMTMGEMKEMITDV
jgi:hypothetical protein